jgi:hypothetical protein
MTTPYARSVSYNIQWVNLSDGRLLDNTLAEMYISVKKEVKGIWDKSAQSMRGSRFQKLSTEQLSEKSG